jgi:hypothetical protein
MKNLPSLGVVLFIAMTAMTLSGGQDRGGKEGIKDSRCDCQRGISVRTAPDRVRQLVMSVVARRRKNGDQESWHATFR